MRVSRRFQGYAALLEGVFQLGPVDLLGVDQDCDASFAEAGGGSFNAVELVDRLVSCQAAGLAVQTGHWDLEQPKLLQRHVSQRLDSKRVVRRRAEQVVEPLDQLLGLGVRKDLRRVVLESRLR